MPVKAAVTAVGDLTYQVDGILASHLLVEAAWCADRGVWLPPHNGTLGDLLARCGWPQWRYVREDQRCYRPATITL